jgi:hypothetical protein
VNEGILWPDKFFLDLLLSRQTVWDGIAYDETTDPFVPKVRTLERFLETLGYSLLFWLALQIRVQSDLMSKAEELPSQFCAAIILFDREQRSTQTIHRQWQR